MAVLTNNPGPRLTNPPQKSPAFMVRAYENPLVSLKARPAKNNPYPFESKMVEPWNAGSLPTSYGWTIEWWMLVDLYCPRFFQSLEGILSVKNSPYFTSNELFYMAAGTRVGGF